MPAGHMIRRVKILQTVEAYMNCGFWQPRISLAIGCFLLWLGSLSAHAAPLTFLEVAKQGRTALDELDVAQQEKYRKWAREILRYHSGKDKDFARNCSQEINPNPLCQLIQDGRFQNSGAKQPLMPKPLRLSFYAAVSALDNMQTRLASCKTSIPKLEAVVASPAAARVHTRALYWLWVCAKLDHSSHVDAIESAHSEAVNLQTESELARVQVLEAAEQKRKKEIDLLTKEYQEAEKWAQKEDAELNPSSSAEPPVKRKVGADRAKANRLKRRLDEAVSRHVDKTKLKLPPELATRINANKKKLLVEEKAQKKAAELMEKQRINLWRKNPFSYHYYLIETEEGDSRLKELTQKDEDPEVYGWSAANPSINAMLRVMEAMMVPENRSVDTAGGEENNNDMAPKNKVLGPQRRAVEAVARTLGRDVASLEGSVRLYFSAVLARFAQANPSILLVYGNLMSCLRDYNEYINKHTLQALFPLDYAVFDARRGVYRSVADLIQNNNDRNCLERIDPTILASLMHHEAGFDQTAKSPAGAVGLMQMLLKTAQEEWLLRGAAESVTAEVSLEELKKLPITESRLKYDVGRALLLGSTYFEAYRTEYFRGDYFQGSYALALAGYNTGPAAVKGWWGTHPFSDEQVLTDLILMDSNIESNASGYALMILGKSRWYNMLYFSDETSTSSAASCRPKN